MVRKSDLDRAVALATGESVRDVSLVTELFLQNLSEAISRGEDVSLHKFGKFKLRAQGGAPPPHARFGGGASSDELSPRLRVHFSKSHTLSRTVKRNFKEKAHGKIRR